MSKHVTLVELNYEVTPIHIRENLSSRRSEVEMSMKSALAHDVFLLATCHRFTFLAVVTDEQALIHPLKRMIPELQQNHLLVLTDEQAMQHWFSTACGLNSRTIGEHEILGQIRTAFPKSKSMGPELNELVKRAIHAGKRARTETKIGRYAASLTSITCNRMLMSFPDTKKLKVMIFGTGEMSRLVLQMLVGMHLRKIFVVSKNIERAKSVCTDRSMQALSMEQVPEKIGQVDVIIGATWTENYLIEAEDLSGGSDQLFIDLGMPRNFDPAIDHLPSIQLLDLNNLNETVETAKQKRNEEVSRVEQIIDQEVADLHNWLKFRELIPEIRSLRAEVDALKDRCCLRIHQELFYLSSQEKKQLCYQIRGLAQRHFSKIVEVLKSDHSNTQKVTTKLEILHALYDSVDELWHEFFAHGAERLPLKELLLH